MSEIGSSDEPESIAGNGSVIALLKRQRTLLGSIVVLLGTGFAYVGTRLAVDAVTATASALPPVYTEGASVKLSTDLLGNLRLLGGGGGGGNPLGGFTDSTRRVGRMDSLTRIGQLDSILKALPAGNRHLGRVAIDSLLDSVVTITTGTAHIGRVAVDSLLDSVVTITTGTAHIGRVTVDSQVGVGSAATLHVTGTAAVNTALTITLPAAGAGLFHYITSIQWVKLYSVVGVANAAGVLITSTNLPGNPIWLTEQAVGAAGTAPMVINYQPARPLRSAVANTATTIVAPLQLQTIWRGNVSYYVGP